MGLLFNYNIKKMNQHMDKATKYALVEIEKMARGILIKNPTKTKDFTMAMGTFFFTKKDGEVMWDHQMKSLRGFKKLDNFISKWDELLHLTGEAMTFTARGKKITNW